VKLSTNGTAALWYVLRLGWCVLPLAPRTKEPLKRLAVHGHLSATRDPAQIARWWSAIPGAGVAVSCAMSGLLVVDVDLYKDECVFGELEARLGRLPTTPRQLTPRGGEHYVFRARNVAYRDPGPGIEAKHHGYVVVAPSVGPDTPKPYTWDVGAHPLDTPLADLPEAWETDPLRGPPLRKASVASTQADAAGGDAGDSWLGHAFRRMGWLGVMLPGGRRAVRCPWAHQHTDGRGLGCDSSTVVLPPTPGQTFGGFRCAHAHCAGRTWVDVQQTLTNAARWAADQAVRRKQNRLVLERLATERGRSR
jgi:hypothetical protein